MFQTVRDLIYKKALGKEGGATHGEVVSLSQRTALSNYLPYAFYDRGEQAYHNTDDTTGYLWELLPLYFTSPKNVKRLQKLLEMNLPKDVVISFHLYADEHVLPMLEAYRNKKVRQDKVLMKAAEEYTKFLLEGTKGIDKVNGIPVRNFRCFFSIKCAGGLPLDVQNTIEEALESAKLCPVRLHDKHLKEFLYRFFNSKENQQIDTRVDPRIPIRKQLISSETQVAFPKSTGRVRIGDKYGYCLTHFAVPETTNTLKENSLLGGYMGFVDDANQILSPFLYSVVISFRGAEDETISKFKVMNGQSFAGEKARELNKRLREYDWITSLPEGEKVAYVHQTLWIFDRDTQKLEKSVARARRMATDQDYEYQQEKVLTPTLLLMSLPFGFYNIPGNIEVIERYRLLPTSSIAAILPVQSDFAGTSRVIAGQVPNGKAPVIVLIGRKGQLQGFDVFDEDVDNHNFYVTAGSGAGKSMMLNNLVSNYYNAGSMIRVLDIGYSLQKSCLINKGRFLDIGEQYIIFNPFYSQGKDREDQRGDEAMCVNVMGEMVYSASGGSLAETEWSLLKNAARFVMKRGDIDDGIDVTQEYLRNLKHYEKDDPIVEVESVLETAKKMAYNLSDFAREGVYGKYFNGPSNFNIADDEFVVLELQQLKEKPELFSVIVMQVVNSVTQDLYLGDRSRQRFVLFEEAAHYLKQQGHKDLSRLARTIEEGYRRARKHGGSFGTVLQSLLDLESFGSIGRVIKANAAFKLYLASEDYDQAVDLKLLDKKGLAFDLIDSIKNQKPRYSEIFWETPHGQGAGRLVVDPWNYWTATSAAKEFQAYMNLINKGYSVEQALSELSGVPL